MHSPQILRRRSGYIAGTTEVEWHIDDAAVRRLSAVFYGPIQIPRSGPLPVLNRYNRRSLKLCIISADADDRRHTSFIGLGDDKDPSSVSNEIK
jgi:hypothetical protein